MYTYIALSAIFVSAWLCGAAQAPSKARLKWEGRVKYGPAWEGVPEPYRKLPFPEIPIPATRAAWESRRPEIRKILRECLGDMPPRPERPRSKETCSMRSARMAIWHVSRGRVERSGGIRVSVRILGASRATGLTPNRP